MTFTFYRISQITLHNDIIAVPGIEPMAFALLSIIVQTILSLNHCTRIKAPNNYKVPIQFGVFTSIGTSWEPTNQDSYIKLSSNFRVSVECVVVVVRPTSCTF